MSLHERMHKNEAPALKRVVNDGWKTTTVNTCAFAIAVLLRFLLQTSAWQSKMADRVELSSPLNSARRLAECVHLRQSSSHTYSSSMCHEMPLVVMALAPLLSHSFLRALVFSIIDALTAVCLGMMTRRVADLIARHDMHQWRQAKNHIEPADAAGVALEKDNEAAEYFERRLLKPSNARYVGLLVALCYLFHPFALLSCSAQTTAVFDNFFAAVSMWATYNNYRWLGRLALSLFVYRTFYPLILVVPVALHYCHNKTSIKNVLGAVFVELITVSVLWSVWLAASVFVEHGNTDFLQSTYGFMLTVPDLTPNVGVFWYFFTEMFEHFHLLFLWTFQLNLVVYVVPLALVLKLTSLRAHRDTYISYRDDAFVLHFSLLALTAIFKPYVTVADAAIYTSMLPLFAHVAMWFRYTLLVGGAFVTVTILAPVMWTLWIVQGSANANFYFATTLVYNVAQVFLVTDVLVAWLRKRSHLKDGFWKNTVVSLQ